MPKVGIVTFHRSTNFGSYLQTYGLYRKIADLGCECEVIDYRCPAIEAREGLENKINGPKDLAKRLLLGPGINRKKRALGAFANENMSFSRPFFPEDISSASDEYDIVVAGSDIIWGRDITENDRTYFLDFAGEKTKKVAFASSVGGYEKRSDDPEIGRLLSNMDRIAVREDGAVDWVKRLSGRHADLVCDPTMLLTAAEWDGIVQPKPINDSYVLVYFDSPDGSCLRDARAYAARHGLDVKFINYYRPAHGVENVKPASLSDFLGLVKSADTVFTASYHGMLFSLYYERDMRFYTRCHSTRVLSLAKRLGVLDRCGDGTNGAELPPIDWPHVQESISSFREESIAILEDMVTL